VRKGGGRQKGSRFELDLAKTISVWWCQDESLKDKRAEELPFRRAPLSGGWDKKAAASDLIVTGLLAHPWPFALEAKCQECWDWEGLFKNNDKWPVKAYWDQCCEAAKHSNLRPLVLFTKNRSPIYFAMRPEDCAALRLSKVAASWLPFVVGRFEDLLDCKPQQIVAGLSTVGVVKVVSRESMDYVERVIASPLDDTHHKEMSKRLPKPVRDWPPQDELTPILGTRR
jgi:hypothetical protein